MTVCKGSYKTPNTILNLKVVLEVEFGLTNKNLTYAHPKLSLIHI